MFYLPNVTASNMTRMDPWKFTDYHLVPLNSRGKEGKTARADWINAPGTKFHCYSLVEAVNPNGRISNVGGAESNNPPAFLHGIAADYDFVLTEAEIQAAIDRMPIKPNWREVTLSGHCRLVWLFPKPIAIPSHAFLVAFMEALKELFKVNSMAGLDEGAWKAPERTYTNGCKWMKVTNERISYAKLFGTYVTFSHKFDFSGPEFGFSIPLPKVAEQLAKKFPGFASWPGDFALDAQGPSFWVDGSTSSKSAIVRQNGMQTFAGHATKGFYTWSELVGADWCQSFKTEQLGNACDGVFYDERHYYSQNSAGIWCIDPKENIVGLLKSERGLSDLKRKGETASELERALVFIQRSNRIKTAASFAFYPEGRAHILGNPVLNLHTKKVIQPLGEPVIWGAEGQMPWLSGFYDTFFLTLDQLPFYLAWLKRFYVGCYERKPRSGQAVYVFGGTGTGKTFNSRGIVGGLVRGFAEASEYLSGNDNFNAELFDHGLWVQDDAALATDYRAHKRASEMVKRIVANPSMRGNGKFQKAAIMAWQGRLMFSGNTDAESVRLAPDMDLSLREKIMIFRTHEVSQIKFLVQEEMEAMLARELPALARFLVDYIPEPQTISADPRFGVNSYLDPSIVTTANQSSQSGAFDEILEEWGRAHFTEREPHADSWSGTALQLHKAILLDPTLTEAMRSFNIQAVGRLLISLSSKRTDAIQVGGDDRRRIFIIKRDETLHPRRGSIVMNGNSAKFQKI